MEINSTRVSFGFEMDVLCLTSRYTNVKKVGYDCLETHVESLLDSC